MMRRKKCFFITIAILGNLGFCLVNFLLYFVAVLFIERPQTYTISQPTEQIVKIEICKYDDDTKTLSPLKELNEQEQESILSDIPTLISRKRYGGKLAIIGEIVVCISYKDGSKEILGDFNVAKIDTKGKWHLYTTHFEEVEFSKMILKYVDEDLLPKEYLEWVAESLSN